MTEKTLQGISASDGIILGPAFIYRPVNMTIPERTPASPEDELARLEKACTQARDEITAIHDSILERLGQEHAAIFEAHLMFLDDPTLIDAFRNHVNDGLTIEHAVEKGTAEVAATLASMEDEYFAARALDVEDVGRRILRILLGREDTSLSLLQEPSIIVAMDLTPSDTAQLDPDLTLGFCTAQGGLTSHTAILARTMGLPAVVGLGLDLLDQVKPNEQMALDGGTGEIVISPTSQTQKRFAEAQQKRIEWLAVVNEYAHKKAQTADGTHIEVAANIGDLESAKSAVKMGAEGVGLLRTEFLYLSDVHPPSEQRQIDAYRAIFEVIGEQPVIVRTLDIGGDKPPSFLDFEDELNPFLGWRAIRICLEQPDLFKTQLRAILRAAVDFNAWIMYPMISGLEELRQANAILEEVKQELANEGLEYAADLPVGIMIETPGAVIMADSLAAETDFFSIGTNDLTQYTLAVDRTNQRVANLYQPLHPAVLRSINMVIEAAHAAGKWVGMCGELAGMRQAIPLLLGMGIDELSMSPSLIPEAKWLLQQLTVEQAAELTSAVLDQHTVEDVESIIANELKV